MVTITEVESDQKGNNTDDESSDISLESDNLQTNLGTFAPRELILPPTTGWYTQDELQYDTKLKDTLWCNSASWIKNGKDTFVDRNPQKREGDKLSSLEALFRAKCLSINCKLSPNADANWIAIPMGTTVRPIVPNGLSCRPKVE